MLRDTVAAPRAEDVARRIAVDGTRAGGDERLRSGAVASNEAEHEAARVLLAAEHEAARARREANPEPEPISQYGSHRCPVCLEDWDVNKVPFFRPCCCRYICSSCEDQIDIEEPCPLCRAPYPQSDEALLALIRRHVENDQSDAMIRLAVAYEKGEYGLLKSDKKAAKIYKRAAELGNANAMLDLGCLYYHGSDDGVKRNWKKAIEMYRRSAQLGVATAQWHLSDLLNRKNELDEARRWCRLAAAQNLKGAVDYLPGLEMKPEPPAGVKLRFGLLARVECHVYNKNDEEEWEPGEIVHLWYHEPCFLDYDHLPADLAPYQIKLDCGRLVYANRDDDFHIRRPRSG